MSPMNVEMTKSELLLSIEEWEKLRGITDPRIAYALERSIKWNKNEALSIQAGRNFSTQYQAFAKEKDELISSLSKGVPEIADEEPIRKAVIEFEQKPENAIILDYRKRQLEKYRHSLREPVIVKLYDVVVTPDNILDMNMGAYVSMSRFLNLEEYFKGKPKEKATVQNFIALQFQEIFRPLMDITGPLALYLAYNINQIRKQFLALQSEPAYVRWVEEFEVKKMELVEAHAGKDYRNEPKLKNNANGGFEYQDVNIEALNEAIRKLAEEQKAVLDAYTELGSQLFEIDAIRIPFNLIPAQFSNEKMRLIVDFVEEPE